ncbi:hypothetical protein D1AOALGA4SA_2738 [Olavius algarvensis Delta 1 endosymbiont]|nr:hypothetical protein D1AOALGA4SA_2738 [Olavius algarvensis Delta 1 endosymbiont]
MYKVVHHAYPPHENSPKNIPPSNEMQNGSIIEAVFNIEWTHKRKNSHYISMIR